MAPIRTDGIIKTLESQEWMKPAESRLKSGLDALFKKDSANGKPIENALHGAWLGHPLHPVMTDIPLGACFVAFVLDVVEGATGTTKFQAGADASISIGIAGAVAAATTGITDWKEISEEARRVGLIHGLLNSASLGFYVASAIQRACGNRSGARTSSYVGFAIQSFAAWLGGHLVYANQIGVERTPYAKPPVDFVNVAYVNELEESKPHRADCQGYPIVLVRKGQQIFAISEVCTHLGAPLSEGQVEGDCIRCPWHGSKFSLVTGEVVESPAVRPQIAFEARVMDGQVSVRVASGGNS